jgi:hypothetical protein
MHEPPVDQWIMYKGFQDSYDGLLVLTKHPHGANAGCLVGAFNAADLDESRAISLLSVATQRS